MEVQERRRLKKIAIMETALEVWAEEEYSNTSLSLLTKALGISKPAIYRYFNSKDDLLSSMERYVAVLAAHWLDELIMTLKAFPVEEQLEKLIREFLMTIKNERKYIRFDAYNTMLRGQPKHPIEQFESLRNLLNLPSPVFRLIMIYCFVFEDSRESQRLFKKRSMDEKAKLIYTLVHNGLGGEKPLIFPAKTIDITKDSGFTGFRERMSRENLMYAIISALQEKGFNGVTLEQIAARAGLSKSSLYNYFKNKDEMLAKTANSFVKEYTAYHRELMERQSSFEEKLLAHLALQERIIPVKPQTLVILKQMVDRDVLNLIERPLDKPGFLSFLEEGIREGKLTTLLLPAEYQIIFSFFMVSERIFNESAADEDVNMNIQDWVTLLMEGHDLPGKGVPD